jgi:hypothetical protein
MKTFDFNANYIVSYKLNRKMEFSKQIMKDITTIYRKLRNLKEENTTDWERKCDDEAILMTLTMLSNREFVTLDKQSVELYQKSNDVVFRKQIVQFMSYVVLCAAEPKFLTVTE